MHIDGALLEHLPHHGINDNVGAGAADASTAVHHDRAALLGVGARRPPDEGEHGRDVVRHAVVRPVREVELVDEARHLAAAAAPLRNRSIRVTHKKTVISHRLWTHFRSSKVSHKKEKKDKTE